MLAISRRPGETLLIGDDIKITITEIKGKNVRIGIEAPGSVTILREELKDGAYSSGLLDMDTHTE